ncbi:hypothetical protein N7G274_004212 [Stereocaulon virgatum]|uniref:Tautomerase cis-CaaD-like domain-containing protein n=1 Tax=Stereocaulon virgatum TaxID=373712 RepID=A0ABR4AB98_9LECA
MPMYEVEHITPLSISQKHQLAKDITKIHSELFTTPSLFVNVRITDISRQDVYIAGKKKQTNRIIAHIRPSPTRPAPLLNTLCTQITTAWNTTVNPHAKPSDELELRAVFVLGTIVAGREVGFELPPAGEDGQWVKENMEAFKAKAEAGDRDFRDLVEEVGRRGDLRGEED